MGTSSLEIYVHHGLPYAIYHHFDGFPEHVGHSVVSSIPTDRAAFEEWLQEKRKHFDEEERRIKALDEEYDAEQLEHRARTYEPYLGRPGYARIDWYPFRYKIDLDDLVFCMNDEVFFSLQDIPRGEDGKLWIRYFDSDDVLDIFFPDATKHYHKRPQSWYPWAIPEEGLDLYQSFASNVLDLDESSYTRDSDADLTPNLALSSAITRGLLHSYNTSIHIARDSCLHSEIFNIKFEVILRAVSPAGLSLVRRRHINDVRSSAYPTLSYCEDREDVCAYYRYRGCVIMLTRDCSTEERLKGHVGLAVLHAQETREDSCTTIIFSFNHVAVVTIQGAMSEEPGKLQVAHSKLHPFLDVLGHVEFEASFRLLAHYLRPHCIDGISLKPGLSSREVIPFDLIFRIMQLVDPETHDSFRLVSKVLRREWFLHPRLENYTLLNVKDAGEEGFLHLPRYVFRALDEWGEVVPLWIYKKSPCAFANSSRTCACGCFEKVCCPCPNACVNQKCGRWMALRVPLRFQEMYPETMDEDDDASDRAYYEQKSRSRRNYLAVQQAFKPNLHMFDQHESCEICSRDEIGCVLDSKEICLKKLK